ncbi:MAG: MFS transporter [Gammaproteobacteria bacterium]|nr:MFS transporter [Gammaproteobacteria bacterium]
MQPQHFIETAYDLMTGDEDARVCKDIPDAACQHQPRNAFAYMSANLLNKIADELTSAKLILPWLLSAIGAPAAFSGFLVPIRESGVLLPQLVVAAAIRRMPVRKSVWLLGAALSSISLVIMALTVNSVTGATAGWFIILALIIFSLARGLCSVSAKDVLGKTVSKGSRGAIMGYSAGFAGVVTLAFGFYVEWFTHDVATTQLMTVLLLISAGLWVLALLSFASIRELPGATEGGGNALTVALHSLKLLKTDAGLRKFITTRILLLSTALAPPFYVMLAQQHIAGGLSGLGMLIIASGIASTISAPIWGRLGDRSSRLVMALASSIAGVLGIVVFVLVALDVSVVSQSLFHGVVYLVLITVHSGVRLGRKVYLVDLATAETRATYVAISNTVIGVAMLFGGLIGIIADVLSVQYLLLLLGVLALVAAISAWRLPEVSE